MGISLIDEECFQEIRDAVDILWDKIEEEDSSACEALNTILRNVSRLEGDTV